METTYEFTKYRTTINIYHTSSKIAVHTNFRCLISILKFTWVRRHYYVSTQSAIGLSPTNQNNGQKEFIAAFSANRQDQVTGRVRTSDKITFHTYWEDEKLANFASPTTRTTRIFQEENGLIFVTSKAPFILLD